MKFSDIHPFVRFSAIQNFSKDILFLKSETISYDYRIYYCIRGKGTIVIDHDKYELSPYSLLLWKAGLCYKVVPHEGDNFVCMTCNFDYTHNNKHKINPIVPSNKKQFVESEIVEKIFFEDSNVFNNTIYIQNIPDIYEPLSLLIDAYKTKLFHYQLHLSSYLLQIILKVSDHVDQLTRKVNKAFINDVIKYIQKNYRLDITNESIAEQFSYHPNYISNLLVKETGYSLHNYLIRYRLSRAFHYLMNTNMPIKLICEEVNITNYSYFSRVFKKYYGVTPQKIRKNS